VGSPLQFYFASSPLPGGFPQSYFPITTVPSISTAYSLSRIVKSSSRIYSYQSMPKRQRWHSSTPHLTIYLSFLPHYPPCPFFALPVPLNVF
jgi:hypothetical protein